MTLRQAAGVFVGVTWVAMAAAHVAGLRMAKQFLGDCDADARRWA